MIKDKIIYFVLLFIIIGCYKKEIDIEEDYSIRYNKAIKYFNKDKFNRAKDEFEYIIMIDPGSKLATQSQYYLAESMFQLEEYSEASNVFDRYVRFSSDLKKIEIARYRICECAVNSANSFQRDQSQTHYALEQLQMFIEDFAESERVIEAENTIKSLRLNLAQKEFQSGRMYLKLEEYQPAIIYFQSVLNQYYDTEVADDARIGIIFAHILNRNRIGALSYYNSQNGRFLSETKHIEAKKLIDDTEAGLTLNQYYQLYR